MKRKISNNRNFTFLIFLLSFFSILAQKSEIQALYTVSSLRNADDLTGEARSLLEQSIMLIKDFEFELLANAKVSIYRKTKHLTRDDVTIYIYPLAISMCAGSEVWNVKKGNNTKWVHRTDSDKQITLSLEEDLQWNITSESKTIGDFKVFKATTSRKRGQYLVNITAWFCPDLNYPFGPLGYGGLPGLILELKRNDLLFQLRKIKNVSRDLSYKKPTETMSFAEYYRELDAKVAAIKERGY